jgi:TRAP-type mannitol/chloroaromatic compound transport system permease small subunit
VQQILLTVDRVNTWIGKTFAWVIVVLTAVVCYEIFVRTALRAPTTWAFDASYILYGTLFMMAGAYTLSRNGHVRGDFIYRKFAPRVQAALDLTLYVLFFFPGVIAFMVAGWRFFYASWLQNEHSMASPAGPVIWPFKFLIPLVGFLLVIQGVAEVIRCCICMRSGDWPQRLHDVEEMEKLILERADAARIMAGTEGTPR